MPSGENAVPYIGGSITKVIRGGPAAAPARTRESCLARRHLEKPERCALRVAENRKTAAREFHRRDHLACAGLRGGLERLVDVADREIDQPVARHLGRNHLVHFLPAGNAFAAELELRIWRCIRAHLAGLRGPAEDLLIEGDRLVNSA